MKTNKTFDFPSKDEEILYNIINQEYQEIFQIRSPMNLDSTKNKNLPNLKDYLINIKDFRKKRCIKKSKEIHNKCTEISKKIEKNISLLKSNNKNNNHQNDREKEKLEDGKQTIENACSKIQKFWRKINKKLSKPLKNIVNICQSSLYQRNREKILQNQRISTEFKLKNSKILNFKKKNAKLIPKKPKKPERLKIDIQKLANLLNNPDSFSSSKMKLSVNTTLNFKEINENSKSLITIHDFNSRSIEREEFSKLTSSLHENKKILQSQDLKEMALKEINFTEPLKNDQNSTDNCSYTPILLEKPSLFLKKNQEEGSRKRTLSEKMVGYMELSSKYQEELDYIKHEYLDKIDNKEINHAAEKFFSLMKKQTDLNKKILSENIKLTKAISTINFHDSPSTSKIGQTNNDPLLTNELKNSLKSNISDLRRTFGSEKMLKEIGSSLEKENEKEKNRIFEEDSFRNFTNRKIREFLTHENIKEIVKLKDTIIKKKKKH